MVADVALAWLSWFLRDSRSLASHIRVLQHLCQSIVDLKVFSHLLLLLFIYQLFWLRLTESVYFFPYL